MISSPGPGIIALTPQEVTDNECKNALLAWCKPYNMLFGTSSKKGPGDLGAHRVMSSVCSPAECATR